MQGFKGASSQASAAATALAAAVGESRVSDGVVTAGDIGVPVVSHVRVSSDNQWLVVATARRGRDGPRRRRFSVDDRQRRVRVQFRHDETSRVLTAPEDTRRVATDFRRGCEWRACSRRGPSNALFTYDIDNVKPTKWSAALAEAGLTPPRRFARCLARFVD